MMKAINNNSVFISPAGIRKIRFTYYMLFLWSGAKSQCVIKPIYAFVTVYLCVEAMQKDRNEVYLCIEKSEKRRP
jgi:hypothetical protein